MATLRRGRFQTDNSLPGTLASGVGYKVGQFNVTTTGANLNTLMAVYPNGLGTFPNFIFTTATNRTEKGVEVLGAYKTGVGTTTGN